MYLKHGVRTVQRWESEGLPVHRHPHEKRSSVYAYPPELDEWWTSHGAALEPPPDARRVTRVRLWASLAAVGALGFVASLYLRPAAEGRGYGHLSLLASAANLFFDPCLSPDGKSIVYSAEIDGQTDLYVARVDAWQPVRLTNDSASDIRARFSPDGERIIFTKTGAEGTAAEVWAIPVSGGPATRLLSDAAHGTWSSDGRRIAFVTRRRGEAEALAVSAADGTEVSILLRGDEVRPFLRNPAWAPDDRTLAVDRSTGGSASEIWLVRADGSAAWTLSHDAPGVFSTRPVFTPGGGGVVHQSNRGGAFNLWRLPVAGGNPEQLTSGPGPDESPSVARDGAIVFESTHERCALIAHDLASGQTREILTHSSYIWAPAFSPDGTQLAFSRAETDGSWHNWIASLKTGAARRLTQAAPVEYYARFTPDGASVLYHALENGRSRLYRVPLAGGPPVALTPAGRDESYADISPDGGRIAFARTQASQTRVYIASARDTSDARLLLDTPATLPRWSPDGRWIAFSSNRGFNGVFVVAADGTRLRRLSDTGSFPVWHRDGKRIAYIDLGPTGTQRILSVPFEGGLAEPLGAIRFKGANNPFDISPDGKLLASSSVVNLSSEIWLMKPRRGR